MAAAIVEAISGQPSAVSTLMLDVKPGLGEVLSPSQAGCFTDCSAKWMFKYLHELPDPKNGNLSLGIAVHNALAENFAQKIDTREDAPAELVTRAFDAHWEALAEETEFREEEEPAAIADAGRKLVTAFMAEAALLIQPKAVELPVEGKIGGTFVQGRVDVLTEENAIIDLKTASKKPGAMSHAQKFQLATYAELTPGASGLVQITAMVKTKTPQVVSIDHRVTEADRRGVRVQYPLIQEAMRSGYYVPNRGSMLCSRRSCPFWRACEEEFGGKVEM